MRRVVLLLVRHHVVWGHPRRMWGGIHAPHGEGATRMVVWVRVWGQVVLRPHHGLLLLLLLLGG